MTCVLFEIISNCLDCLIEKLKSAPGGGGGTPLYGLYGDVPLNSVWFLASSVLNRVYNFMRTCPRQGLNLS